ncbi:PAS domain-containing protein (plasmid) [Deinococcus taeanensis]|uniref:sensor histidine kinase n=1 Tax=Deinococcus taeanensis TaxID=2737050 RepID=UPI001CDB595E|nr:ATP-binding protein [Deinococcus taeanensis]UBV45010.1 PAS domain-containing protein [Deinococcus taeanensis]
MDPDHPPHPTPADDLPDTHTPLSAFPLPSQGQDLHHLSLSAQLLELQRANKELQERCHLYQDLYDHAPVGYCVINEQGVILNANHAAAQLLQLPLTRLMGRRFAMSVAERSRTSFATFLRRALDNPQGGARVELELLGAADVTTVQVDGEALAHSEPRLVRITLTDISALHAAQRTISDLNRSLEDRVQQRTAQVMHLNGELESFVHAVTRGLQTPLRRAAEHAQRLTEQYDPQDTAAVLSSVEQMNRLMNALSTYFRVGRQRARFQPVNLERLMQDVRKRSQPTLAGRPVIWTQDPLPDVTGDSRILTLIFTQLLDNAAKFTAGRNPATISILVRETATEHVIGVADNGAGFNMRQKDRLFTIFERLHPAADYPGLGLGLAHVKRGVLRHGGRVWAEGKEGEGARFWVALPKSSSPTF